MKIRYVGSLAAILLGVSAQLSQVHAQLELPKAGYEAIAGTTIGSLPAYLPRDLFFREVTPAVFHLRYGTAREDTATTHSVGGTIEFPLYRGRFGVTGGFQTVEGTQSMMVGVDYQSMFSRGMITGQPTGPLLLVTFKVEAGMGLSLNSDISKTLFASGFSLPMSIPFGGAVVIAPYVAPGMVFGLVSDGVTTDYQTQITVAAGVAIHNPSRLDLTLGVQRVVIDVATNVFGIGLTWNR